MGLEIEWIDFGQGRYTLEEVQNDPTLDWILDYAYGVEAAIEEEL